MHDSFPVKYGAAPQISGSPQKPECITDLHCLSP